jgi:hypothetical protein
MDLWRLGPTTLPAGTGQDQVTAVQPAGIARAGLPKFLENPKERTAFKLGMVLLLSAAVVGLTIVGALRTPTGGPSR